MMLSSNAPGIIDFIVDRHVVSTYSLSTFTLFLFTLLDPEWKESTLLLKRYFKLLLYLTISPYDVSIAVITIPI